MSDRPIRITKFRGLAPRFALALPAGFAAIASGCDLYGGRINALKDDLAVQAAPGETGTAMAWNGSAFVFGEGASLMRWPIDGVEHLYFLQGGVLKKTVAGVTANVGQARPAAPTLLVTTVRHEVGGKSTELKWTASTYASYSGKGVYYLTKEDGSDPGINPLLDGSGLHGWTVDYKGVVVDGTVGNGLDGGSGANLEDSDSLGFETIYVCLDGGGTNPNDLAAADLVVVGDAGVMNAGSYDYIVTTVRTVGGEEDESGPSDPTRIEVPFLGCVRISRPVLPDLATAWRVYRTNATVGIYQLVAEYAVGTALGYDASTVDLDLGETIPTWYASDLGTDIIFSPPSIGLEGITATPHGAMIFAWKGTTLYWSEPGKQDAWPSLYRLNFPFTIKAVVPFAGALAVLTEGGPFRVDGTHPERLIPSEPLGHEPCVSPFAYPSASGVVYASDSGIALFDLIQSRVLSDTAFDEAWFREHIDLSTAKLIEVDGKIYLFHSTGTLVLDSRDAKLHQWTTLPVIAQAACVKRESGAGYYLASGAVYELGGGASARSWQWRSGKLPVDAVRDIHGGSVEVQGTGPVSLAVYQDGALVGSKALTFGGMLRERTLGLNDLAGGAMEIDLSGTGSVTQVLLECAEGD